MKKHRISLLFLPMAIVLINIYLKEPEIAQASTDKLLHALQKDLGGKLSMNYSRVLKRQPALMDSIFQGKLFDRRKEVLTLLETEDTIDQDRKIAVSKAMDQFVKEFQAKVDPRIKELFPRYYEFVGSEVIVGSYKAWQSFRLICVLKLLFENALLDVDMSPTNYCENRVSTRLSINKRNERILEVEPCGNYKKDLYAIQIGNYKDSFKNSFKIEMPIKELEKTDRIISFTKIWEGKIRGGEDTLHLKYKLK